MIFNFHKIKKLLLIASIVISTPVFAQTIELDNKQNLVISTPGFFPFSSISNDNLKELFPSNPNVTVEFSNFLGNPCALAPAADFSEIGPQVIVNGNGTFTVDFSMATQNTGQFGLSFVPQGGSCIFELLVKPPVVSTSTSSTSSGEITIMTGSGNDTLTITPNALTVFSGFLSDETVEKLSNEKSNPGCGNSPFGIETITINGSGGNDTINVVFNELGVVNFQGLERSTLLNHVIDEPEIFTLIIPENRNKAKFVHNQNLTNTSSETRIYATAFFPSFSLIEESNIMVGANRSLSPDIEVTLKEQNNVALAAVQHAIISATMPWQLSTNGGYFITQGGGCVGPFCTIVEAGMVVIDPDGACTPEKLNKRRAGYPTFNPSKFFDPFPSSANVIQIPAKNIVDPRHPLVSKVVKDNAYLILQPVPPGAKIKQQLKLNLEND